MSETTYSLTGIHLPSNKYFIRNLKIFSKVLSLLVLLIGIINLIGWILRVPFFLYRSSESVITNPAEALLFILAAIAVLLQQKNKPAYALPLWRIISAAAYAGIIFLASIITIPGFNQQINLYSKINFFLLSLILILLVINLRFINRMRFAQFFAVIIAGMAVFSVIQYMYTQQSIMPLSSGISFLFICFSIVFTRAERGFMAVFTADSTSSILAIRLLITTTILFPFLGYLHILGVKSGLYNYPSGTALAVTVLILISTILIWFNMNILYNLELERFMIREELRVRNIKLAMDSEDLGGKLKELEQSEKKAIDRLNYQDTLKTVLEKFE